MLSDGQFWILAISTGIVLGTIAMIILEQADRIHTLESRIKKMKGVR